MAQLINTILKVINICSKATSESGTDISLKDRRNEYVYNNMSLCEENCNVSYSLYKIYLNNKYN